MFKTDAAYRYGQRCLWLVLLALGLSAPAMAEVVANLYTVMVKVESQSSSELQRAGRQALAELFIRVSGQAEVLNNDTVAAAVRKAETYTRQYRYERVTTEQSDEEQLLAVLEFEQQLVDDLLRRAGVPLWANNRPTVLVWLAVEDLNGRHIASLEKDPQLIRALGKQAVRRGLPVKRPFLDLQDMVALNADDIWEYDVVKLKQASERYAADTLLVGRVTQLSNGRWLGRWHFEFNGQRLRFDGDADTPQAYIAAAFDTIAEAMAAEYAIAPVTMAEGGILLRLTEVNNFVDYARAIRYLEGVAAIHHANVISIDNNEMIIRLLADGQLPQLKQAFALDKRLLPQNGAVYQGQYPVSLDYRWPTTQQESDTAAANTGEQEATEAIDASQLDVMDNL